MVHLARHHVIGRHEAGVDDVLVREQSFGGEMRVDRPRHGDIGRRGGRRLHVGDQMGSRIIARLRQVHLVAGPFRVAFLAIAGLGIVG